MIGRQGHLARLQGREPGAARRADRLRRPRAGPGRLCVGDTRRSTCSCAPTRSRSSSTGSGWRRPRAPSACGRGDDDRRVGRRRRRGRPTTCRGRVPRRSRRAPSPANRAISAWLPIVYGCDKTCTYCIVPFSRGPERSRPFDEIVAEARAPRGRRLPRGHAARPERQLVRPRPAAPRPIRRTSTPSAGPAAGWTCTAGRISPS